MSFIKANFLRKADILGKYLDQPVLIKKISDKVPVTLIGGAAAFGLYDTFNDKEVKEGRETKTSRFIKNASILTGTVASTLIFGKKFIHMPHHCKNALGEIIRGVKKDSKIKEDVRKEITNHLETMKKGKDYLSHENVKKVYEYFEKQGEKGKELMSKVFPIGHDHGHGAEPAKTWLGKKWNNFVKKNPEFHEIKDLSLLGTVPVLGGVAGGIVGDSLSGEDLGKTVPNKIKEGTYQYLANIMLCNVGAGAALFAVNKTSYKNSKPVKFGAMLAGIATVGVAGGSLIANYIGKKIVNPALNYCKKRHGPCPYKQAQEKQGGLRELYNERTPEAIDIGLHVDDLASAGFLSGLNVIAPVLPILYSVSAYRAGVGYRNNKDSQQIQAEHPCMRNNKKLIQTQANFPCSKNSHNDNDVFQPFRRKAHRFAGRKFAAN